MFIISKEHSVWFLCSPYHAWMWRRQTKRCRRSFYIREVQISLRQSSETRMYVRFVNIHSSVVSCSTKTVITETWSELKVCWNPTITATTLDCWLSVNAAGQWVRRDHDADPQSNHNHTLLKEWHQAQKTLRKRDPKLQLGLCRDSEPKLSEQTATSHFRKQLVKNPESSKHFAQFCMREHSFCFPNKVRLQTKL